ncbi:MAG TPA: adenylosuccinate lyase [Flavobacteriales bacterium]|nr:adenylosuccinate lyase [Flavobacteriales bacterium]
MELTPLTAISPIDGRYRKVTDVFASYFSEYALMKYRVLVEVEYFIALCEIPLTQLKGVNNEVFQKLRNLYINFTLADAQLIKDIEETTNHDVKAVEYFLRDKMSELGLTDYQSFIHFGLTSQDINNTAIPLSLRDAVDNVYYLAVNEVLEKLKDLQDAWSDVPMLARTHGQPASPTRVGKEIKVYTERINVQIDLLKALKFSAKFGGATGNFNAHHVAYPHIDWVDFGNNFVNNILGLHRSQTTTQIEHYDNLAALCDNIKRINNIFIDLNRDIWTYISMEYFGQQVKKEEVGSSAMPHKVNPIDFENSEGNAGMANASFEHFSSKLPISRLQRDLTDSTVLRNLGTPFAHTLIACKSLLKGLNKLFLNEEVIKSDLIKNKVVIAEAIQTILRREGISDAYEKLKELTRINDHFADDIYDNFIDELDVSSDVKSELKAITPFNYTGV